MTALAGLWRFDGRVDAAEGCGQMLAAQELYGPHMGAQWSQGTIALGRRLMRVLPEDALDHQPLRGGGGRYVLVADIRLDNRDDLVRTLHIPTAEARDLCDAAVLLAAVERWGEACVDWLVGDYAFAFWDGGQRRLWLARDPLGQRPLHYHRGRGFFAFASMPKGLHALAEIPHAPDEEYVAESLLGLPETGTRSFFDGIERVQPGHAVTVVPTGVAARRHWRPPRRKISLAGPEEYAEASRELMDQAVRCRLRGARDVGAQLSGGLDSSAVAATAAQLSAPLGGNVIAFTAVPRKGYSGPAPRTHFVDEGPYATAVAALYPNMEHVLIRDGRSPLDELDRIVFLFDRPVLNICNVGWEHSICDAARERKLTVLLTGAAGNLGLSYNGSEMFPELLRSGRWLRLWKEGRALVDQQRMRWRGVLASTFGPWCPPTVWILLNKVAHARECQIGEHAAIHPRRFAELDLAARAKAFDFDLASRPCKDGFAMRLSLLRGMDPGNHNKGVLGGWQIDMRDPTADVRVLEFCLAVPTEQFFSNGVPRALARRAFADRLPACVVEETRRGLQAADWHERLTAVRDRVAEEVNRLDACPSAAGVIDLARLRRLVENWPAGGWERPDISTPYRLALLRAISAGHFLRRVTGSQS